MSLSGAAPIKKAKVGRPKSDDPSVQIAVYPPGSVYQRIKAAAEEAGEKPATFILAAAIERIGDKRVMAKNQRNIYPPESMWEAVAKLAHDQGVPVARLFVELAAEGLKVRGGNAERVD